MTYATVIATPLPGNRRLGVVVTGDGLSRLDFLPAAASPSAPVGPLGRRVAEALEAYFAEGGDPFAALPLAPEGGTPYQQRIWYLMRAIPPGRTERYGHLAVRAGSGPRAVANACRANPVPIVVPCHRVVAAGGLGGYMGARGGEPLELKAWLLAHEAD